jgi:hypothetical protein
MTVTLPPPPGAPPGSFDEVRFVDRRRIIGLSGYPSSGKDTVAKMLVSRGYKRIAFADPLRALAYDMDPAVHDRVDMEGWEKAKANDGGYTRRYLQKLGERARHHIHPNVWVDAGLAQLGNEGNYVFTDVRYRNEAGQLRHLGAKLARVERPGHGAVNDHTSELEMDGYEYDAFINNNGDLNQLFELVMSTEERLFS